MMNDITRYEPALRCFTQEQADRILLKLVEETMEATNIPPGEALELERKNIAYMAGYRDSRTRARVEKLFQCSHPVFGAIEQFGEPSPAKCLCLGILAGSGVELTDELRAMDDAALEQRVAEVIHRNDNP